MTSTELYKKNQADCRAYLKAINTALDLHAAEQAANPADWGYAGDLAHTRELLFGILEFMGTTEPVSEAIQ